LVDPNSVFFKQIAEIFHHFEESRKITVFQPISYRGKLSVEMRHLDLSFKVNSKGLLECRELQEEIDPDQNAGVLYGLQSKIVLRDIADNKRRSIIVPWGKVSTKRHGMHVAVRAAGSTEYARYGIDNVLGRLSCPAEPRLLYAKAQFHAFTSFVIPDPLTGRTGTEEALHILQSGHCQPWTPLGGSPIEILNALRELSPGRKYYPKDKKHLQSVSWNADLTMTVQHDAYESLVQDILSKSERLRVFAPNNENDTLVDAYTQSHLRKRGNAQRRLYARSILDTTEDASEDRVYNSRGQETNSAQAHKIYHIARLLQTQPFSIHTTRDLFAILQDWPLIGGFHTTSEILPASLSDAIEVNVDEQWGSLVNACRSIDPQELYSLMFRLSLMSLNPNMDMDIIEVLAAYAILPVLKTLRPASSTSFNHFKLNESPTAQSIFRAISVDLPGKPKRGTDKVQEAHRNACMAETKRLAEHFLDQWPSKRIVLNGFESDMIDTGLAMERVIPEWCRLHENMEFSGYIMQVQDILDHHKGRRDEALPNPWKLTQTPFGTTCRGPVIPSISTVLLVKPLASPLNISARDELVLGADSASPLKSHSTAKFTCKEITELRKILSPFISSSESLRQGYGGDLDSSLNALEKNNSQLKVTCAAPNVTSIARSIQEVRGMLANHFLQIRNALSADDDRFQWLDLGNLWPCNTSMEILEQLCSRSNHIFGNTVKEAIVSHGVLITALQRLMRIENALCRGKHAQLQEELGNSGHITGIP
jgi:hypothetical protein